MQRLCVVLLFDNRIPGLNFLPQRAQRHREQPMQNAEHRKQGAREQSARFLIHHSSLIVSSLCLCGEYCGLRWTKNDTRKFPILCKKVASSRGKTGSSRGKVGSSRGKSLNSPQKCPLAPRFTLHAPRSTLHALPGPPPVPGQNPLVFRGFATFLRTYINHEEKKGACLKLRGWHRPGSAGPDMRPNCAREVHRT